MLSTNLKSHTPNLSSSILLISFKQSNDGGPYDYKIQSNYLLATTSLMMVDLMITKCKVITMTSYNQSNVMMVGSMITKCKVTTMTSYTLVGPIITKCKVITMISYT